MPLPQLRTDYNVLAPKRMDPRDAVNALVGVKNMEARTVNQKAEMANALVKRQEEKAAAEQLSESRGLDIDKKRTDEKNALEDRAINMLKLKLEAKGMPTPDLLNKLNKLSPETTIEHEGPDTVYETPAGTATITEPGRLKLLEILTTDPRALSADPSPNVKGATRFDETVKILDMGGYIKSMKSKTVPRTDEQEIGFEAKKAKAIEQAKSEVPKEDKYLKDKGALVDDTNTFYRDEGKSLMDPEFGGVRIGPEGDPDKYLKEYIQLFNKRKADMVRIKDGKLPSWLEGEKLDTGAEKPDPAANSGRIIKDTETGERFQSNGTEWIKIENAI